MATLFKPDGTTQSVEPKNGRDFKIEELWDLIGGYVQVVSASGGKILIVDEEGLLKHRPLNKEASKRAGFMIVGDALLCDKKQLR